MVSIKNERENGSLSFTARNVRSWPVHFTDYQNFILRYGTTAQVFQIHQTDERREAVALQEHQIVW